MRKVPDLTGCVIKLSGREFKDNFHLKVFRRTEDSCQISQYAQIIFRDKSLKDLYTCDFKDEIEICSAEDEVLHKGPVKEARKLDEDNFLVLSQDDSLRLKFLMTAASFINMTPYDITLFITNMSNMKLDYGLQGGLQQSHNGKFEVVAAIQNFQIDKPISINGVRYYIVFNNFSDRLINKYFLKKDYYEWDKAKVRASIVVYAPDYYKAIKEGIRRISETIDLISLANDISFPKVQMIEKDLFPSFAFQSVHSDLKTPVAFFCSPTLNHESCMIYNAYVSSIFPLSIKEEFFEKAELLQTIELGTKKNENYKIKETLHWLYRSKNDLNSIDKLLDLWTALEFLLCLPEFEVNKAFSSDEEQALYEIVKNSPSLSDQQKEIACNKLKMVNNPPIMAKLRQALDNFGIRLSDYEWNLIKESRQLRNKVIHGSGTVEISESLNLKLRSVIQKIIIKTNIGNNPSNGTIS